MKATRTPQRSASHQVKMGQSGEAVNDGGDKAGSGGNGHADKVFSTGAARIFGNGVGADVEAGEPAGAAEEKEEADEGAELDELDARSRD